MMFLQVESCRDSLDGSYINTLFKITSPRCRELFGKDEYAMHILDYWIEN